MTATDDHKGRGYWERHAKRYDKSTRFLSRPVPRMLELAVEAARGKGRVLEVAAGTGLITTAIAPVVGELIATDYATAMVGQLEARVRELGLSNVSCEQADIYALRFEPASFDAVFAANVLHLVPDVERALAGLRGVLKSGGVLVVPTYLHAETIGASVLSRVFALTGFPGQRRFTASSLHEAIETAGVRIEREETIRGPLPIGYVQARVP
jgi:phosphatidylethanolamine/phosphatidyl-N-methylethanolamine N-methyltransferase